MHTPSLQSCDHSMPSRKQASRIVSVPSTSNTCDWPFSILRFTVARHRCDETRLPTKEDLSGSSKEVLAFLLLASPLAAFLLHTGSRRISLAASTRPGACLIVTIVTVPRAIVCVLCMCSAMLTAARSPIGELWHCARVLCCPSCCLLVFVPPPPPLSAKTMRMACIAPTPAPKHCLQIMRTAITDYWLMPTCLVACAYESAENQAARRQGTAALPFPCPCAQVCALL